MKVLVLGASSKPERYAFVAAQRLRAAGHLCYLLGARAGAVRDMQIRTEWPSADAFEPETLTLYLGPDAQKAFWEQILACGCSRVIFNPGTENPALEQQLTQRGAEVVRGCTLVMLSTGTF
jgi:predicted CoA-binding protein